VEGSVKVWDLNRRTVSISIPPVLQEKVNALAFFSKDDDRLAVAADSGIIRLYDLNTTRLEAAARTALR
jgi:WD40 repeat protein